MPPGTDITLMKMVKFGFGKLPLDTGAPQPPESELKPYLRLFYGHAWA